jgi:release factor glutamine methyltransferase
MASEAAQGLTAREALRLGGERLQRAGVASARLDMSLLLARALGTDRLGLYTNLDRPLTETERQRARELLARRTRREPMAYILGEKEFFGLTLEVDASVLIPRPETEFLVAAAIDWLEERRETRPAPLLADIGAGSGAIAVVVAKRCPWCRWIATDVAEEALAVTRRNAERHGVAERIECRRGTLWDPIRETVDGICSNPPYVAEADRPGLEPEVALWEPAVALFSDRDGMAHLEALAEGAAARLAPGGLLLLECGRGQAATVAALLEATGAFAAIERLPDLTGIERVVRAERKTD